MANFIPKIIKPLLNYVPDGSVDELVSLASKAARLKIITDRYTRGFPMEDRNGPMGAYEYEQMSPTFPGIKEHRDNINPDYGNDKGTQIDTTGYVSEQPRQSRVNTNNTSDYISIIDIDYVPADHDDKRYYSYLQLPFVPRELDYNPESNFVGIASFGRNNPYYQFTGSEDTLTFEIDWHSKNNEREDVIFNCRWLEALTKGDAYDEMPHRVVLSWGRDNKLFRDSEWLVISAPYRLSQFVGSFRDPSDNTIVNVGLLPQQAYQQITLKRLTKLNRSTRDIIGSIGKPTK